MKRFVQVGCVAALCLLGAQVGAEVVSVNTVELLANEIVLNTDLPGSALSTPGDLNGDGIDDLYVSDAEASGEGPVFGVPESGEIYMFLGGESGLDTTIDFRWSGATENRNGVDLATGDWDNDGEPDIATSSQSDIFTDGVLKVFYGLGFDPWFPADPDMQFNVSGLDGSENCGDRMVGEGDLNGDGIDDLVVACPEALDPVSSRSVGLVAIYFGQNGGLFNVPDWTLFGTEQSARFGAGLAILPDIDGDGDDELLIGSPLATSTLLGEARLYLGEPGGPDLTPSQVWTGEELSGRLGTHMGPAGDVNCDGFEDLIIGSGTGRVDRFAEGTFELYHGSPFGLHPVPAWTWAGEQSGAEMGNSLEPDGPGEVGFVAADMNGDGCGDIVLGVQGYSDDSLYSGQIRVSLGGDSPGPGLVDAARISGSIAEGNAGLNLTSGDYNGDGRPDIVYAAPSSSTADDGEVFLAHGPLSNEGGSEIVDLGGSSATNTLSSAGGRATLFSVNADKLLFEFDVDVQPLGPGPMELGLYSASDVEGPYSLVESWTVDVVPGRQFVAAQNVNILLEADSYYAVSSTWTTGLRWYSGVSSCGANDGSVTFEGAKSWQNTAPSSFTSDPPCPQNALRARVVLTPAVDADGDGVYSVDDCDDDDPFRGGSLPEVCDGLDNDCNGLLDQDAVAVETGDGGYPSASVGLVGVGLQSALSVDVVGLELDLDPGTGGRATLGIFERLDAAGSWTRVTQQGLYLSGAPGFQPFGPFDIRLQAGREYAFLLESLEPVAAAAWDPSTEDPEFGTWLGGPSSLAELPATGDLFAMDGDGIRMRLTTAAEFDRDGDGFLGCVDCNDDSTAAFPGAPELCNDLDDDCDGDLSDDEVDDDGDGETECEGDCDDGDALTSSTASEVCDGLDNDCNGVVPADEADLDGDLFRPCAGDCDDLDAFRAPNLFEICDGLDNDCDGALPADEADGDGDGHNECSDGDCDDADNSVFPDAFELCDGQDNDCDGSTPPTEVDNDGDGDSECADDDCDDTDDTVYDNAPELCDGLDNDCDNNIPSDETDDDLDGRNECSGNDCDDANPAVFPGAIEVCDGLDSDCSGSIPADETDDDGDGQSECLDDDCDDTDPITFTGAVEICDGQDNDCDNVVPADESDDDGDGLAECPGNDCDDTDDTVYPGAAELCDAQDNDCDGIVPADETDDDGDGQSECLHNDCDDTNNTVFPGNPEGCDGLDNDCDGVVPDTEIDDDGDGRSECDGDCDDTNGAVFPGNVEVCDDADNDCDGVPHPDELDLDGDGFGVCANGDCDDANPDVFPGAVELCDGLDTDCTDGVPDDELDEDLDGRNVCSGLDCDDDAPSVFVGATEVCDELDTDCDGDVPRNELDEDGDGRIECDGSDCNDADGAVFVGAAEICDGLDTDCNGSIPPEETDDDGDGLNECDGEDCDDNNPTIAPRLPELCDGVDTDCDGLLTPEESDDDGDGQNECEDNDCDDDNIAVFPGATEACDGLDTDCDGVVPDSETDDDGDGRNECGGLDCDDGDGTVFPGAVEICDGVDNNCDLDLGPAESDDDGDGSSECLDGDCDDTDDTVFPGATEACDGLDTDCDGTVPDDETDGDGDGQNECEDGDCDDEDVTVFPGATEACDGLDTDCDGTMLPEEEDDDGDTRNECPGDDQDCDDEDVTVFPGAPEVCDGVDTDCDGVLPADEADDDGDGFNLCLGGDCDDEDEAIHPDATEVCNGIDDDCDGALSAQERDDDGDAFNECDGDCQDGNPLIHPGASELCDGQDNDCDVVTDELGDRDEDGASLCDGDCDDTNPAVASGRTEVCDGFDNDCDDDTDEDSDEDEDGDSLCDGDCDDSDPLVFPSAEELCDDGLDNDCDGDVEEDCPEYLGPLVSGFGVVVGCNAGQGGSGGLLAGLLLLGLVRRRRAGIIALLLLAPALAHAGAADDVALEAHEFHQAWCADTASADSTEAASALEKVVPVLKHLSEIFDKEETLYLLYWRGLLHECTHQDERALADLDRFTQDVSANGPYASMVKEAHRRQNRIQQRGRYGRAPTVPRLMIAVGGGYQLALGSSVPAHFGAVSVAFSGRLIGPLRLEGFGRLGISDALVHESGAGADPVQRALAPVVGVGAAVRLLDRGHLTFGLAFQMALHSEADAAPLPQPGARASAAFELPLVGGRLYVIPRAELGFVGPAIMFFGGVEFSIGI